MSITPERSGTWSPDWAVHPGEHLLEHIEARGLSQAELARLADLSPKLISTIVSGKNPVSPETAVKLERVLGVRASIWTGLQADWDLHQARMEEQKSVAVMEEFMGSFPIRDLIRRGALPDTNEWSVLTEGLLRFLAIGTPSALPARVGALAVHHRHAKAFESDINHIVAWLMLGEWKARAIGLPAFDREHFIAVVRKARTLTVEKPEVFEPELVRSCREAGVALVLERPLGKTRVFGSARWMDDDRAIIQMSLRMKSNDHFWWTLFHEAAHLALHRGLTCVDDQRGDGDKIEREADEWAEEMLVGRERFEAFKASQPRSEREVRAFAEEIGIHPGIVVGMLQHHGVMPFKNLNGLKVRFDWAE